jgi:syntaxin 1B/2/3
VQLNNRSGQASSVLGAVRARHNEIQRIEQTLSELAQMFNDMAQLVVAQEPIVEQTEANADDSRNQMEQGNKQINTAIKHARNRNKLKWWCLLICILIILGIALGVGLGVGLNKAITGGGSSSSNNNGNAQPTS